MEMAVGCAFNSAQCMEILKTVACVEIEEELLRERPSRRDFDDDP